MAAKARYRAERQLKVSSPSQKRCANCGKKIQAGKERTGPDGNYYGSECIEKVLDRANSLGRSE